MRRLLTPDRQRPGSTTRGDVAPAAKHPILAAGPSGPLAAQDVLMEDVPPLPSADPRFAHLPIHDRHAYADTLDLVGEAGAARLLDRLIAQLDAAFQDGADRERVAREAHALISTSGLLGCPRLSETCRDLEEAAKAGIPLEERLAGIRRIRDLTAAALRTVRQGGAGDPAG
ncbi:Hpt protein [Methylobacterium sp. 4-46]|nr:Hpt protein [Methylobacterium sp. 4-46]